MKRMRTNYERQDRLSGPGGIGSEGPVAGYQYRGGKRSGARRGPFSAMDLLIALYFRVMNIRPEEPRWPERDRFILSKGHSSIGPYVVMALRGFLPVEE